MDYTFDEPPFSGDKPRVFLDLNINNKSLGKLEIELFRDVFPLAVENFVYMCKGTTYRIENKGFPPYLYKKVIQRSYEKSKAYELEYNNYIKMGDIYKNNGTGTSSIYCDQLIPEYISNYCYKHTEAGLISLIPILDEQTGKYYYDSNFLITLNKPNSNNSIADLDTSKYIVIGRVYSGMSLLTDINKLIEPFSGRTYPVFSINKSDDIKKKDNRRRHRPVINDITKYALITQGNI